MGPQYSAPGIQNNAPEYTTSFGLLAPGSWLLASGSWILDSEF